jgi:hypothetical protein
MQRRLLRTDQLLAATYDARASRLEIEFNNGDTRAYKGVPEEVARRFLDAPNPASFWEDRIAEEYPWERVTGSRNAAARAGLDALFGTAPPTSTPPNPKKGDTP